MCRLQLTVLLVEDEQAIRKLLRTALERAGYEVMEASDGDEALRLAHGTGVDLLITDIVMPGKEGIELTRYFRKHFPQTKIIVVSGNEQYLRVAQVLGADAVFTKPFQTADLLITVARLLRLHDA